MKNAYNYDFDERDFPKRKAKKDHEELIMSIEKVKTDLNNAYANFDLVTDPNLVDSYIYEVKAIQLKYEYLIRQAKALGIIYNKYEYTCNKDR